MPSQNWVGTLVSSQTEGSNVTNTLTAKSILPPQAVFTLPNNYLDVIGKTLRIQQAGRISTKNGGQGTITFDVRIGNGTTLAVASGLVLAANQTNIVYNLTWLLTARTVGQSASFTHILNITSAAITTTIMPASITNYPFLGSTFDATAAQSIDFFATWSVQDPANAIQSYYYTLESLN